MRQKNKCAVSCTMTPGKVAIAMTNPGIKNMMLPSAALDWWRSEICGRIRACQYPPCLESVAGTFGEFLEVFLVFGRMGEQARLLQHIFRLFLPHSITRHCILAR